MGRRPMRQDDLAEFVERRRGFLLSQAAYAVGAFVVLLLGLALATTMQQSAWAFPGLVGVVVAPAILILRGRDRRLDSKRLKAILREPREVVTFDGTAGSWSRRQTLDVVYPPGFLLRVDGKTCDHLEPVDVMVVTQEPESAKQTAEWIEAVGEGWGSRELTDLEVEEVLRVARLGSIRIRWWTVFFLAWCGVGAFSLVTGTAQRTGNLGGAVLAVVSGYLTVRAIFVNRKGTRMMRECAQSKMVRIVLHEDQGTPHRTELLMPYGLEWSVDGVPSVWRR